MIIKSSELVVIFNEFLTSRIKEINISPFFTDEIICSINFEKKLFTKKVTKSSWDDSLRKTVQQYSLSERAHLELPNYNEIINKIVSAGVNQPKGIEKLISYIRTNLDTNKMKRIIIGLDTNQLIYCTMSNFIEQALSQNPHHKNLKFRVNYAIAQWVMWEKSQFLRTEKRDENSALSELATAFKDKGYYLGGKIDKQARLGYGIIAELKALENNTMKLATDNIRLGLDEKEIRSNKEARDEAIISEYCYLKNYLDDFVVFVSSDKNAISMAKGRKLDETFEITIPNEISNTYPCDFTQTAKLLYQLTLLFGSIRINNELFKINIWFSPKEEFHWEEQWVAIECKDNEFFSKIKKSINLIRMFNSKYSI